MAENVIVRNSEGDDVVYEEVSGVELLTEDGATATFIHDAEIKQANWEQTDSTQKDYIRNKPKLAPAATEGTYASLKDKLFGDIPIVLEETELSFEADETFGTYCSVMTDSPEMFADEIYKITWDGTEYLCLCHKGKIFEDINLGDENMYWFGNQTLFWNFGRGENTGEPFCIWRGSNDEEGFCIETLKTDATHTISIVPVNEVMKLDKKYLPDDIGGSETELPKVTESDNGKVLGVVGGAWGKMSVSAGGTGGVSSWNDLLDKPFGEETVTIFEGEFQDTLTDSDGDGVNDAWSGQMFIEDTSDTTLEEGKTYTVTWEGTEYELECFVYYGNPVVGNTIILGGEDNGVPFCIMRDVEGVNNVGTPGWLAGPSNVPTDLTISGLYSCKISGEKIKKIDEKYINLHQSDWEATDKDSAEFLKNKPFGIVLPESAVVVECETSYDQDDFGLILFDLNTFASYVNRDNVKEGASYYVKCGEYEYEGIGISASEATALHGGQSVIGGMKIFNSENIHVATLFIGYMNGICDYIWFEDDYRTLLETGASYPVKITCNKEFVKKLDSKYIPDGVATESWVQSYVEEYIKNLGLTSTT